MNEELKNRLNSINAITVQNIQLLLVSQTTQIEKALMEILPSKETISKDELWEILDLILSELVDVKDQVSEAKDSANSLYTRAESLQDEARETADRADDAIYSITSLKSTINSYKDTSNQEAA